MVHSFLKRPLVQHLQKLPRPFHFLRKIHHRQRSESQNRTIKIYDAHSIETCPWPQSVEGQYAKKLLTPLIKNRVTPYISNVCTDLRVLIWDQLVLPITINDAEYDNSYVCSPYSYYISYAKESLSFLTNNGVYHAFNALLWGVAKIFKRYDLNKVVVVNNWLYSTNLYPPLQPEQLTTIVQFLQERFPDYAIVFRSVDSDTNPICYQTLQQIGFEYIASRQIFFIDPHHSTLFESRLFKNDLKLLKNSGYEIIDGDQLTEDDISRVLYLYQDLYIQKYSDLNPQFTEEYLRLLLKHHLMHFKGLKKDGRLDGIVGYVQRNGKMFCPFFGYDRSLPKETAMYRLLSTMLMLEAYDRHLLFHQSSGASTFKMIRKAHASIEYIAVSYRHLHMKRQFPWVILKKLCNSLGIMYMKRY
jgi:hypothetical protein